LSSEPRPSDYHDGLTGLPNRRLLDDRLRLALHGARRRDARVAFLLVALEDFPRIDDALVRAAAARLEPCVRKADTLARFGPAQFAVVLNDVAGRPECSAVAERLLAALPAGASLGISLFPDDAGDAEALIRNAEAARLGARQGRGQRAYRFYAR